jgi:hypothetical protein
MRELSVRSILISHLAMFVLFCLLIMIGYSAILTVLHVLSGAELSDLHQRLKSDKLFRDIEFTSGLSLSAAAAGWLAAKTSTTKPLVHGALSSAAFFLLFLCVTVYGIFQSHEFDLFWSRPLLTVSQLALPLFGTIGASILLLGRSIRSRKRSSNESPAPIADDLLGGLAPIAWKWFVWLIWLGSIATFETLEILRYRSGKAYRPFFALFVAAICAFLIWIVARAIRDRRQRKEARRQSPSGQLQSPLHWAANGLVLVLFSVMFYIVYINHNHAPIPSFLWIAVPLNIAALLLLRRALKWRYPYV